MCAEAVHNKEELFGMDFYVPEFEIYVGGKKTQSKGGKELKGELKRDIINVSYTDNLEAGDSFSLTVCNWDAVKRSFKYMDFTESPYKVGTEVEVWMGYAGGLHSMINGEITSLEPSFPASGNPTLNVRGINKLKRKQETHFYKKKTDAFIARKIAFRLDLVPGTIKTGAKYKFLAQTNRCDIVFLMELAKRVGFEVVVEGGRLDYMPSTESGRKKYVLEWGKSLISFRPVLSISKQVPTVRLNGWDPRTKTPISRSISRRDLETRGIGVSSLNDVVDGALDEREETIVDTPVHSNREADIRGKAVLERIAKELVKGEGRTIGLPDLRAGSALELKNLGKIFDGNYYVTGTTHSMGEGGYTTSFRARKEEISER